jgi:hypothetical protein
VPFEQMNPPSMHFKEDKKFKNLLKARMYKKDKVKRLSE